MWTRKRQLNNLVPPFKMCKLIPAGEFKKSALVWELNVYEKLDDAGNVIECNKFLVCLPRDATIRKPKVPKTAKQRLKLRDEQHHLIFSGDISYIEAICPAPTVIEIMKNTPNGGLEPLFCAFHGEPDKVSDEDWSIGDSESDLYFKNGYEGKNPAESALRWWFEQKGIE